MPPNSWPPSRTYTQKRSRYHGGERKCAVSAEMETGLLGEVFEGYSRRMQTGTSRLRGKKEDGIATRMGPAVAGVDAGVDYAGRIEMGSGKWELDIKCGRKLCVKGMEWLVGEGKKLLLKEVDA
ncbi:hypothetical protein BDZ91DRAFT_788484 [Kalaharituber pfeilii]|nr:hypothetical protein BDZ91DRAFT_788484 [Kalaharituber pfeilii]